MVIIDQKKSALPPSGLEFIRKIPIVVLANGDSASASEIMIGALRDLGRAKIVGTKSFGKGIFQVFLYSRLGESRVTAGNLFTPRGYSIHKIGFHPDVEVVDTRKKCGDGKKDKQLKVAIKTLLQLMRKNRVIKTTTPPQIYLRGFYI